MCVACDDTTACASANVRFPPEADIPLRAAKFAPRHWRPVINSNKDGELEIWLNEAGRDLLVKELQCLSELEPIARATSSLSGAMSCCVQMSGTRNISSMYDAERPSS